MQQIYKLIKLNRLIRSYRVKFLGVLLADIFGLRHLFLRLDPVMACNLKCSMCYFSDQDYVRKIRGRLSSEELNRIAELFFPRTLQLVVGCAAEPTLHKGYIDIILLAKENRIPFVGLTTNGQLINDEAVSQLVQSGLDEITLSLHGVSADTYEKFMVNGSYERVHQFLSELKACKKKYRTKAPEVRINYTVNAENLDELEKFFEIFGAYSIDTLQVRPMVDVGNTSFEHQPMTHLTIDRYNEVVARLQHDCSRLGVVLLSTRKDPNFTSYDKGTSYVLPAVLRTIAPNKVWLPDFNWKVESYRDFCRRIGWRFILLKTVLGRKEHFKRVNHYLTYDID